MSPYLYIHTLCIPLYKYAFTDILHFKSSQPAMYHVTHITYRHATTAMPFAHTCMSVTMYLPWDMELIWTTSCTGQSHPQTDRIAAGTLRLCDSLEAVNCTTLLIEFMKYVLTYLDSNLFLVRVACRPKRALGFPNFIS